MSVPHGIDRSGAAGGTGAQGMIGALNQLADPGGDRIVFWDDSESTLGWKHPTAINVKDPPFNAAGDGVTDDTTAFNSARTAARTAGKTLYIERTPLISSAITISSKEHWVFAGAPGNAAANAPDSYLIKAASLNADFVTITAQATKIEGGGLVGQNGNGGCGYVVTANGVELVHPYVKAMGSHGIRVGSDAGVNSNSFSFYKPVCLSNGGSGIYVHDATPNANAGTMIAPFCFENTSHGIYFNSSFGNSVFGPLCESNDGKGIYLDEKSVANMFFGGDIEGNSNGAGTAGSDIETVTSVLAAGGQFGGNGFIGTQVATPPTDAATMTSRGWVGFDGFGTASGTGTMNGEGTFTPTIAGSSTAGTNTYSVQSGRYFKNGRMITAMFDCLLTGNSVAMVGNLRISGLPFACLSGSLGAYTPSLVLNLALPAGTTALAGALNGANLDLYAYGDNTALTAIPVANISATTGRLSGVITYITPATS